MISSVLIFIISYLGPIQRLPITHCTLSGSICSTISDGNRAICRLFPVTLKVPYDTLLLSVYRNIDRCVLSPLASRRPPPFTCSITLYPSPTLLLSLFAPHLSPFAHYHCCIYYICVHLPYLEQHRMIEIQNNQTLTSTYNTAGRRTRLRLARPCSAPPPSADPRNNEGVVNANENYIEHELNVN